MTNKKNQLSKEERFPHSQFPVRLEHMEGDLKKICFFQNKGHLQKYIDRAKMKKNQYEVFYKE